MSDNLFYVKVILNQIMINVTIESKEGRFEEPILIMNLELVD